MEVKRTKGGAKLVQTSTEKLAELVALDAKFRSWHRSMLPPFCIAQDLDLVEFRGGKPVALLELTYMAELVPAGAIDSYLGKIVQRFEVQGQGERAAIVAELLAVPAYILCLHPISGGQLWEGWACKFIVGWYDPWDYVGPAVLPIWLEFLGNRLAPPAGRS